MRRILSNSLLIVVGLILGLCLAEAATRILGLAPPGFFVYDRYTGWALRPGASGWQREEGRAWVQISSQGMRDRLHPLAKPPHTLRIAVLGDSYTEAQQVPQSDDFCSIVQTSLRSCPALHGRAVETMNFGCDSYGTAQELMTLRTRVWQYAPDIVVVAFCTGNDVRNDSRVLEGNKCQPFFADHDGALALAGDFADSALFRAHCMARFDSQGSAFLNLLGHARSVLRARYRLHRAQVRSAKVAGSEPGLDDVTYRPPATPAWQDAWRVAEGELQLMHQEAERHGAKFMVVTLSNGIQVYPDPAVRAAYMRQLGISDLFYPDQRLATLGEREGFPVLNLAPPMQQYADRHHVFLHGFDNTAMGVGHWNAAGHHLAGQLIARRLCELLDNTPPSAPPR